MGKDRSCGLKASISALTCCTPVSRCRCIARYTADGNSPMQYFLANPGRVWMDLGCEGGKGNVQALQKCGSRIA